MRALRLNLKVRDISFPVRCLTKYVVSGQFLLVLCHILQIICFLRFITFSFPQVLTAQDLVDFSPVYRCLHIYSVLVCMTLKDLLLFFFFFFKLNVLLYYYFFASKHISSSSCSSGWTRWNVYTMDTGHDCIFYFICIIKDTQQDLLIM